MPDIRSWLEAIGLGRYADVFVANDIDLDVLPELTDEDLEGMGVSLGHRRRMLRAISDASARPPRAATDTARPLSYTPQHLAERILDGRATLEGERKQVTVLFADVAGFTALSEQVDPEAVHTLMEGCFAILAREVHRYEGTINQYTGDGIMALFGAPLAHEDHAFRAAHAALGIQEALADYGAIVEGRFGVSFQMRIGLNTGPVVIGRIGDDLRMEYTALGDTVNLAARMEQMAAPGEIYVTGRTHRLAGDAFEWGTAAAREVRGKASPVTVHRLLGRGQATGRFEAVVRQGLTPLVGRRGELSTLIGAWEDARRGAGRVVSVVGEAGLGKTRLLYEFKRELGTSSARCVEGTCFTYGEAISYLPFLHIVRALCALSEGEAEAAAKDTITAALSRLGLSPDSVAPYLQNLLSYPVDDPEFARLTPELVRGRTAAALSELLLAAAAESPLVVIIEDVHWIDSATEEVIGGLVEAMAHSSLLLVLVYRPEYLHQWGDRPHYAEVQLGQLQRAGGAAMVRAILAKPYAANLPLQPLSADESRAVARRVLGEGVLAPELERFIVDRTEGNPLFVEELTRALMEEGMLREDDAGYRLARPVDDLTIPATLEGVLLSRIDRLPDELKETLRVAAVIGRVFGLAVLSEASTAAPAPIDHVLMQLQDLDFVYPTGTGPERSYSFKHVLAQEAVYSTLLSSARAAHHAAIGAAIEMLYPDRLEEQAEILARHYGEAGVAEKAVTYLESANRKAVRANSVGEAYGYFTRARELFADLPDTRENRQRYVRLLCANVIVFQLLFLYEECYRLHHEAHPITVEIADPELEGMVLNRLAHMEWAMAALQTSLANAQRAGTLLATGETPEELAYARQTQGWNHLMLGNFAASERSEGLALEALEQGFNLRWHIWALSFASLGYSWTGRFVEAIERGERALATARGYADASLVCFASWVLGVAHACRGNAAAALALGSAAVEIAPTPSDASWAGATNAWFMCRAGRLQDGIAILTEAVAANRAAHFIWAEVMGTYLAEAYVMAGEHAKARATLDDVLAVCEPAGMRHLVAIAERLMGDVERAGGQGPEARARYERAIELCRDLGAENDLAHSFAGLGALDLESGDRESGVARLGEALAIYERLGTLGAPDAVRAALAEAGLERQVVEPASSDAAT